MSRATTFLALASLGSMAAILALLSSGFQGASREELMGFGDPVLALEFAESRETLDQLLAAGKTEAAARQALLWVQRVDIFFPLFYGGLLASLGLAGCSPRHRGIVVSAAILAIGFDVFENDRIARVLAGDCGPACFRTLAFAARAKFSAIAVASLGLVPAVWSRSDRWRWASVLGVLASALLALGNWKPERAVQSGMTALSLWLFVLVVLLWRSERPPATTES
ncbi:MAG: hypothetical protein AAGA81_15830 [Acidobacteriota bacterium]